MKPPIFEIPSLAVGTRGYVYQPLQTSKEIRVLVINPADRIEAPLTGYLEHCNRREGSARQIGLLNYTCLSYSWGQPLFSHTLHCDGGRISITANVDTMLRQLRRSYKPKRFWIDAICLNQADNDEKRQQVPLMGEIYHEARKVVIWMPPVFEGQRVLDFLRAYNCGRLDFYQEEDLVHVLEFLKQPWFRRRWVIQEQAVNPHVLLMYSGRTMLWTEVLKALRRGASVIGAMCPLPEVRDALDIICHLSNTNGNIWSLLHFFSTAQCSDERDRLTAFQGLIRVMSDAELMPGWQVDYSKDWVSNYKALVRATIIQGHADSIWQQLGHWGNLSQQNPSWPAIIPDWTNNRPPGPVPTPSARQITMDSFPMDEVLGPQLRLIQRFTAHYPCLRLRSHSSYFSGTIRLIMDRPNRHPRAELDRWFYRLFQKFRRLNLNQQEVVEVLTDWFRARIPELIIQGSTDDLLRRLYQRETRAGFVLRTWLTGISHYAAFGTHMNFVLGPNNKKLRDTAVLMPTDCNCSTRRKDQTQTCHVAFDIEEALLLSDYLQQYIVRQLETHSFFVIGEGSLGIARNSVTNIDVGDTVELRGLEPYQMSGFLKSSGYPSVESSQWSRVLASYPCEVLWDPKESCIDP